MRDDLPFGWKQERLSGLCLKSNQKDPRKDPDSSFIYVDVSSISNHSFSIIDTNRIMGKDAPSRARKLIQKDDVIFATVRPTLKRVALVTEEFDGQICSTGFCVLRANKDLLDPNFLYYYLLTEGVNNRVEGLQKGATYPAISDLDLFNQTILLPPLPEQRAIARALRAVQGAREARLREVALERERKAALMEHLFAKGTRGEATKMTEIGEMPESWEITKLGNVADVRGGFAFKSDDYSIEGVPLLKISNVSFGKIVWEDLSFLPEEYEYAYKQFLLKPNDLVMAITRPVVAQGIKVAKLSEEDTPCLLNQRVCQFVGGSDINLTYLYYVIHTKHFIDCIINGASGSQQPNISTIKVERIKIGLPILKEQENIALILSACDSKIAALDHEARLLGELFRAMLEELMSGRLPAGALVKDAD